MLKIVFGIFRIFLYFIRIFVFRGFYLKKRFDRLGQRPSRAGPKPTALPPSSRRRRAWHGRRGESDRDSRSHRPPPKDVTPPLLKYRAAPPPLHPIPSRCRRSCSAEPPPLAAAPLPEPRLTESRGRRFFVVSVKNDKNRRPGFFR